MANKTTAVATTGPKAVAAPLEDLGITIEDLRRHYAPGATDKEFAIYADQVRACGLDPRKKEVYFVKYGQNPGQVVTAYTVYIKRAERSGKLDGWDVNIEAANGKPVRATITIYRKDWTKPFVWTVDAAEFLKSQSTHASMPGFMLRKIAIAQGMRLCFPEDIGGLPYTNEEIETFADEDTVKEIKRVTAGSDHQEQEEERAPVKARATRKVEPEPERPAPEPEPEPEPEAEPVVLAKRATFRLNGADVEGEIVSTNDEGAANIKLDNGQTYKLAKGKYTVIVDVEPEPETVEDPEPEPVEEQPAPKTTKAAKKTVEYLDPEKVQRVLNAFKSHEITKKELEVVLQSPADKWTEPMRVWLIDKYNELDDKTIDTNEFKALRYEV